MIVQVADNGVFAHAIQKHRKYLPNHSGRLLVDHQRVFIVGIFDISIGRMLSDIKCGRINCVIVKDLARSFRNYSDQGYYLDDWFPRYNVRFISLFHQSLDSYKDPQNMRSIAVPIQGVLNENHCAETSDKVREVFRPNNSPGRCNCGMNAQGP